MNTPRKKKETENREHPPYPPSTLRNTLSIQENSKRKEKRKVEDLLEILNLSISPCTVYRLGLDVAIN